MRGGLRSRLIVDSVRVTIIAGLSDLGWFDATVYDDPAGLRRHRPLRYIARPLEWDVPIAPNALAISTDDITDNPQGLGGDVEDHFRIYVDLFAQDAELGWHVSADIRDLLLGLNPTTGRVGPVVDVYDLRQATPAPFTQVDIDNVTIDRAQGTARDWQKYWFMIRLDVLDDYSDEFDSLHPTIDWSDDLLDAWQLVQSGALA